MMRSEETRMPDAPAVSVSTGALRGSRSDGVDRYLGIPYAAPPFGPRRFEIPQPPDPWEHERDATRFGPTAPQAPYARALRRYLPSVEIAGEDILTVNVWTPADRSAEDRLPVLVFVHGGALTRGAAALPSYDGTTFARHGIVFVSVQYRLGQEGFAVLEDVPHNLGVLDQQAALRWVRREIRAFGGDARQVTVMGHSAGAATLAALLALPHAGELFDRAILQSGPLSAQAPAKAARMTRAIARRLGLAATRAGFASASPAGLAEAQAQVSASGSLPGCRSGSSVRTAPGGPRRLLVRCSARSCPTCCCGVRSPGSRTAERMRRRRRSCTSSAGRAPWTASEPRTAWNWASSSTGWVRPTRWRWEAPTHRRPSPMRCTPPGWDSSAPAIQDGRAGRPTGRSRRSTATEAASTTRRGPTSWSGCDRGSVGVAMTTMDEALQRDQAILDVDWHVFPEGTERDLFAAPSGLLARVRLGDPDAPRVVLVSGVAGSKEDFVRLFPLFRDAGYRVESYDLAGHYESVDAGPQNLDPPGEHYDYRLFVDDLIAILEDGSAPVHVLGYSFAGLVAELAMVQRPELFASLTLMAAPPATGQVFRGVKHIGPISDMPPHRAAGLILWGIRYNLNRTPPQRIAFVRERLAVTLRPAIDDVVGLMMTMPDIADDIAGLGIPILIAVGEQDLWPTAQHRDYAQRIGARVAVYATGHAPCETAPHQLARDMLRMFGGR